MEHSVAIRANGNQIRNWVDYILLRTSGKRKPMVDMNEPSAQLAIGPFKVKAAYAAR